MALAFGPRNFLPQKSTKCAKEYIKTKVQGNQFSGFWILSEDRLLTPARPRYLLTPDSFFPLRLRRARSSVLPALLRLLATRYSMLATFSTKYAAFETFARKTRYKGMKALLSR